MTAILPWIMSAITVLVMWLAGSKWKYTWHLSLANQVLWLIWILKTENWGFVPMNVCMWIVTIRNLWLWSGEWVPSLWEYGNCRGRPARRHRINRNVQFVLWKKGDRQQVIGGEHVYEEDFWHDFHHWHWPDFVPDKNYDPNNQSDPLLPA